jgi:carboxyl-terminal processing protease
MKKLRFFKRGRTIILAGTIVLFSWLFVSFDDTDDFELAKNLDIYHTLVRELRLYYVDDINLGNIFKASMDQMLETLDPYTVYYPESEIEDYRFITTGQYGGIGALMRTSGSEIVIEEIYENYPADKAGFKPGDIIKSVGGQEASNTSYDDISILMKGAPETEIEVSVFRPGQNKTITKILKREQIRIENVPFYGMINNSTAYIKLTGFTQTAFNEVKQALVDLKAQNATSLILDLRDNPGGLLIEAVKIVSLFVEKGTNVVNTKGKVKQWNQNFNTTNIPVDTQMPIVVIVNRNSASASEIVAGALQDLDRAVVLGERTYGKGLVQTTRDLSYNAKLKVTTAKYYIPSGRCIQALDYSHRNPDGSVGFIPDSLISEFKTANGRIVFDGGGVSPDYKLNEADISPIARQLYSDFIIFDYATLYTSIHDSIKSAESFKLSDDEYNKFIEYVLSKNIVYKTETELALDKLIETAQKEKYYDKAKSELETMKKSLNHGVKEDMLYFKNNIQFLLSAEIVKRYFYQKGAINFEIHRNIIIDKAVTLIENISDYNSLLQPQ